MSPAGICGAERRGCFPRVSGDEPVYDQLVRATLTFSPRERG